MPVALLPTAFSEKSFHYICVFDSGLLPAGIKQEDARLPANFN
jgi:hypothetical protein